MNPTPPTAKQFSLTPEWPSEYPPQCGRCQQRYDIRSCLEFGPGPTGRFLKKWAPWTSIGMILFMFITKLSFFSFGGNGGAMAFAAALVLPAILLNVLASVLPRKARLYCPKCRQSDYFPLPKKRDNRIPSVSE